MSFSKFNSLALCLLLPAWPPGATAQPASQNHKKTAPVIVKNRAPLAPNAFYLLPLTSIRPAGWLRRQLQIQADGLTGHLDEFWPDVGPQSAWLGGAGEGWERGPYYLDGLLPLAYLLDDAKLKAKTQKWIEWALSHQRPDGSIGPEKNTDWWPNMIMLKVLTQYHEATSDARVIPLMERYFAHHAKLAAERPLRDWGRQRWADELVSILWLYNRNGDARLLDLARTLKAQGRDWRAHFANFSFTGKVDPKALEFDKAGWLSDLPLGTHGVNNAMAMKTSTVWSQVSGDEADRQAARQMLGVLDRYHPQPNGLFSADEHYAGPDPSQGIELCAVVEAMFSLEHVIAITGDSAMSDRLERITFNALPATFDGKMWAHQYDQQPNQVLCSLDKRNWSTNGPESNLFGMEPNFGCCTANMHQGWPKFAASLWMATSDDGLAAAAYAPCEVKTVVKDGVKVAVSEETEYPFRDEIRLTINPERATTFPLKLHIPAWATEAIVTVNGKKQSDVTAGTFHTISRRWNKGDRVMLKFPMKLRATRWHQDAVAVERGPLVFALKIGEDWRKVTGQMKKPAIAPAIDWEVHPTTAWNYGLAIDTNNPEKSAQVFERKIGDYPFTPEGAPVEIKIKGRRLPQWTLVNGSAGPLPPSPVASSEPEETLTLIPYGSAKLRITTFPQLATR